MKTIITIFFFIISIQAFAQTEAPIFIPDTIVHIEYYKSNQVKIYDARIEGVPSNQYSLKRWYTRAGKTILYDSIDAAKNIIYIAVFRKDGTPISELRETKTNYTVTYSNRNSQVTDIYSGVLNERRTKWEVYENGVKLRDTIYDRYSNADLDTLKYYEEVVVKGKKTTIRQNMSRDSKITLENHIRMIYSQDSVLLNEGLYNFRVKNCGYFIEYYPSGAILNIGEFDKRGYKNYDWFYFDESGNVTKRERFYKGTNVFR